MKIKVLVLKNWCTKNITPLAWQREKGFELAQLEEPTPEMTFGEEEFGFFSGALDELYKISFPKEVLQKIQ